MTTGATQPELHVDVWSGNHPFYTGTQKILDTEGRVDRFMRKYGMGSIESQVDETPKAKKEPSKAKASPQVDEPTTIKETASKAKTPQEPES